MADCRNMGRPLTKAAGTAGRIARLRLASAALRAAIKHDGEHLGRAAADEMRETACGIEMMAEAGRRRGGGAPMTTTGQVTLPAASYKGRGGMYRPLARVSASITLHTAIAAIDLLLTEMDDDELRRYSRPRDADSLARLAARLARVHGRPLARPQPQRRAS